MDEIVKNLRKWGRTLDVMYDQMKPIAETNEAICLAQGAVDDALTYVRQELE